MNNIIITLEIILIAILILFTGLLTMSEFAIVSSRKITLQKMSNEGNKKASKVIELIEDPNEFLSTAQIGITLIGIITGAIGGTEFSKPLGAILSPYLPYSQSISFIIVIAITTYFTILIGELVPKRIGLNTPEKMAIKTVGIINLLAKICRPLVNLLNKSTDLTLPLLATNFFFRFNNFFISFSCNFLKRNLTSYSFFTFSISHNYFLLASFSSFFIRAIRSVTAFGGLTFGALGCNNHVAAL